MVRALKRRENVGLRTQNFNTSIKLINLSLLMITTLLYILYSGVTNDSINLLMNSNSKSKKYSNVIGRVNAVIL